MKRQFTKFALSIKFSLLILCTIGTFTSQAQTVSFRVFFKDKGPVAFSPNSPLYNQTRALFTERALERRRKVLTEDSLFTITDAPLYAPYLDSLKNRGANILVQLRWKNYAIIEIDTIIGESFKSLPFVKNVQPTREKMTTLSFKSIQDKFLKNTENTSAVFVNNCGEFGYGRSFNQAQMLNVPALHSMGFTGSGTLTGFLDNGFRWKSHNALKNTSVVGEYDFIFQDSITENEPEDISSQDNHGTPVLSTVAGFLKDSIVGIAPTADFLLGKTEDMRYERRIEEDNYAAGVEWMESRGADVISSSLGYFFFDEGDHYSYGDLDGKTTITAQAVNRAVAMGVVCVTAAGNDGPGFGTIATPGDADSVITAAAVTPQGVAAGFSSRGPRVDGFIKPDIAAQGQSVVAVATGTENKLVNINGTSFSTPITAGNATLLLSAFPELKPWEVRRALYSSGSQATAKDEILGHGIPNMVKAFKNAGIAISPLAHMPTGNNMQSVSVFILGDESPLTATLSVRFKDEVTFQQFILKPGSTENLYTTEIPWQFFKSSPADAFVTASNAASSRRMPFKGTEYSVININQVVIPCGVNPDVLKTPALSMPYPSVVTRENDEIQIRIAANTPLNPELRIFNVIGQLLYSGTTVNRVNDYVEYIIPTDNFPSGAYFIYIQNGEENEFSKFVISR